MKYGVLPIHRAKYGKRHPHVIVLQGKTKNVSVGLTSSNSRGDLKQVKYSNGKTAYIKREVSINNKSQYEKKREKYYLDVESENYAYNKAINWMLKQIGKNK